MTETTDAELAFLQSMQPGMEAAASNDHAAARAPSPAESDEDYDPSSLMPDTSAQDAQAVLAQPDAALDVPSRSESRVSNSKPAPAAISTKQPRTVGGFAVDSSDEDGSPVTQGANGHLNIAQPAAKSAEESLSQTPNNATPLPDVPINSAAQEQGASGVDSPTSASLSVPKPAAFPSNNGVIAPFANPTLHNQTPTQNNATAPTPTSATAPVVLAARLPTDVVGKLEDRIAADPRGDIAAWQDLISEYRKRNKIEETRATYERFFEIFPRAAEEWVAYTKMESDANAMVQVESIFTRCLRQTPNVKLWNTYLDYVRRITNVNTDTTGNARKVILQAFDFVLKNIGIDPSSGYIWQEYINFVKSGPGTLGGTGWQDAQKMDEVRKAYQRAVVVPTRATNAIWGDYQKFENENNKTTARKFLQEYNPAFVTARSSAIHMASFSKDLDRTTIPKLPPVEGHEGHVEYMEQVKLWKNWINWEKDDPLYIKNEDLDLYKSRIVYVYKQALMALQFWPDMWFEAAEFCFQNGLEEEANKFLRDGAAANPESLLLAFKLADRAEIESASQSTSDEQSLKARGDSIRAPYDKALDAIYILLGKAELREKEAIQRANEESQATRLEQQYSGILQRDEDEDNDEDQDDSDTKIQKALQEKIEEIKKGSQAELEKLKQMISSAWIGLMRAMRRVQGQGKGKPGGLVGGFRKIFTDARTRGKITSKVYVESALIEYHCYKDPAATKIFDRGMRLYPNDESFALEYLKHLIAVNDVTNARQVFETTVGKLAAKPETLDKAKPLFAFLHEYESQYGELLQIETLEKRMADLWPNEPRLELFAHRFWTSKFDPISARPIISPAAQLKPSKQGYPSIEEPSVKGSPRVGFVNFAGTDSPKRPFNHDESDNELLPPRKLARGESPLKGAAGRRLDASRRQVHSTSAAPARLPHDINFLFSIIPNASSFEGVTRFNAAALLSILRDADLNKANLIPRHHRR